MKNGSSCTSIAAQSLRYDLKAFAVLLLLTLVWDWFGYDLLVSHWFGNTQGFPLKNNPFLEKSMHDLAANLARAGLLLLVVMVFFPMGWFKSLPRPDRVHAVLASALCAVILVAIKNRSSVSCPWSLADFGGVGRYVSHWTIGVVDGGGGRCFPGGHSSSGFAYLALALWLRLAGLNASRLVFWLAATAGMLFGAVQLVRGAHFFSHALWSWIVCWGVALLYYHTVQIWRTSIVTRHAKSVKS